MTNYARRADYLTTLHSKRTRSHRLPIGGSEAYNYFAVLLQITDYKLIPHRMLADAGTGLHEVDALRERQGAFAGGE